MSFFAAISAISAMPYSHNDVKGYISAYSDVAVKHQAEYGIPASITLAQGILESGAGKSDLAIEANNHFGIKCHKDWEGERYHKDDDEEQECFRVYGSAQESFDDHARFLRRKRYSRLFALDATDYKAWARGLRECGYATNPEYANMLIGLIERYDLARYDTGATAAADVSLPQEPDNTAIAETLESIAAEMETSHPIKRRWGLHYVRANRGETLSMIAKELGMKPSELASFNDLDNESAPLATDETVWIQRKEKVAAIGCDTHVVTAGETLWSISQHYGIRLKNLASRNHLPVDAELTAGQQLRLR